MITQYSATDTVRLELLAYENPGGLHPIEEQWRDLCRKMMIHIKTLQDDLENTISKVGYKNNLPKHLQEFKKFNFPGKFSVEQPIVRDMID